MTMPLCVRPSRTAEVGEFTVRILQIRTAEEFQHSKRPDGPSRLVLDVSLLGVNGLDFQRELVDAGVHIPIIFFTGYGDIPLTVKAMKSGAVEFPL